MPPLTYMRPEDVREARDLLGWSQGKLGQVWLNHRGHGVVSYMEHGKRLVDWFEAGRVAALLLEHCHGDDGCPTKAATALAKRIRRRARTPWPLGEDGG